MLKRPILLVALLGLMLTTSSTAHRVYGQSGPAPEFLPGVLLVGFEPGQAQVIAKSLGDLSVALRMGDRVTYRVAVQPGQEVATAAALRGRPGVAFAGPDYLAHALDAVEPNDPRWTEQWGPRAIAAPGAWSVVTGTRAVTVAVVDSGIALDHPDLRDQVWTNPREIPANGLDDDGNGQVDDVHGWHFFHSWNGPQPAPQGDANVQDDYDFGHGTHVAGIIGASGNNGIGITGVGWDLTLMPVKVIDANGLALSSEIASGIVYAVDNGAPIINISAGGAGDAREEPALRVDCQAVAYARRQGRLVVASAGNDGGSVLYPAACPGAIAVAATGRDAERLGYSNHGPQVALAAPGEEICSTARVGGYIARSGTSMAAPHVSGLAALVWTRWPAWTDTQVSAQITSTATDLGSPGWDEYNGWGRVDASRAVRSPALPHRLYFPAGFSGHWPRL